MRLDVLPERYCSFLWKLVCTVATTITVDVVDFNRNTVLECISDSWTAVRSEPVVMNKKGNNPHQSERS